MDHDTGATLLFDLEGVAVSRVYRDMDGVRVVELVTTDENAAACPSCGSFNSRSKGRVVTHPRDLAHGGSPVRVRWTKRRRVCLEVRCKRGSFTEQVRQVPARMRLTERLREACGQAVVDGGRTVVQAGRELGTSWPVVMQATREYAEQVLPATPPVTEAIGIDETRRGRAVWRQKPDGAWELVADPWHIGFVDAVGGQGLFGQVEGRTSASVQKWLAEQPGHWRHSVRYAVIDLCPTFRSAIQACIRTILPNVTLVVDCFHLVQLANRKLAEVRRRLTWKQYGRRARKGDAAWTVKGLLRRNKEDLKAEQLETLKRELEWMGTYGKQIRAAWRAKELLRDLLRLTYKHAHTTPDHSAISAARFRFQNSCATHAYLPELVTLAETVDEWWDGIEAYITTGITNAASEGNNRLIKLDARNAFGYRNRVNQRLRSRCATTRCARREGVPG
jgi:transposase